MHEEAVNDTTQSQIEQLQMENALLREQIVRYESLEQKLAAIFEQATDMIVLLDMNGVIMEVNDRVEDIFGITRDDILGQDVYSTALATVLDEKDQLRAFDLHREVMAGTPVRRVEFKARKLDGTPIYFEANPWVIHQDGKPAGELAIIHDITRRKRNQEQLRQHKELLATIFEQANDMIVLLDMNGTVVEVNDRVEDIFGFTRDEVMGFNVYASEVGEVLPPEDLARAFELHNRNIEGQASGILEFRACRRDGRPLFIEVNPSTITGPDGLPQGELAVVRDITRRKQDEEALKRYRERLENMVQERTAGLEEANTALKVLLKKRDEDRQELEDKVLFNVKELVIPYCDKLRECRLNERQQAFLDILDANLKDVVSPYVHGLSARFRDLTPTEIQVANLIIQGKSSKEMADILGVSKRTIDAHRRNIRDKLGLTNTTSNLRAYLLSLS